MNKKFFLLVILVLGVFVFESCQKYPSASFTTDKQEYSTGETISLTNLSLDGDSYEWTFPNGETSTEKTINYVIPSNLPSGLYPIQLKVYSKNKNKVDEQISYVSINQAKSGAAMFWLYYQSGDTYATVNVQGSTKYISSYEFSTPSCDDSNCANFYNLSPGTYNYTATSSSNNWSGSFTIPNNPSGCVKVALY